MLGPKKKGRDDSRTAGSTTVSEWRNTQTEGYRRSPRRSRVLGGLARLGSPTWNGRAREGAKALLAPRVVSGLKAPNGNVAPM